MNLNLKKFLKNLKLNEENISMILGALVIIIVGILVTNYFKSKKAETLTGLNTTKQQTNVHTVTKGETLWSIAEDSFGSGYNWVDIKSANNLTTDNIEIGQELTIPSVAAKQPTVTKTVISAENPQSITGDSYVVVKGDCLWNIAVRAYGDGYQWTKIAKANNLKNPSTIHSGNVFLIPR